METVCNRFRQPKQVTQDDMQPFMQPLMEMVCNRLSVGYRRRCCIKKKITGNPSKLPKTICNPFGQPLIEMVCNHFTQPK